MGFVLFTLASSIVHGFGKSPVHLLFGKNIIYKIAHIVLMSLIIIKTNYVILIGISVLVFALCLRKLVRELKKKRFQCEHMIIKQFILLYFYQIKWWNIGDLDPKFKWVIIAHAGSLSLLCVVANIYIWATPSCSVC